MSALTTVLLGALVSVVTQGLKKVLPSVNPLVWVAGLAIIGGSIYGIAVPMLPPHVLEKILFSFATAISFYEVLKSFVPKK